MFSGHVAIEEVLDSIFQRTIPSLSKNEIRLTLVTYFFIRSLRWKNHFIMWNYHTTRDNLKV